MAAQLPIDEVLDPLRAALDAGPNAVLEAPPGAGKTTRVPLALLDASWRGNSRIVMLAPRRLAARSAARFMAARRGEAVGETVGYRVRLDSKVSAGTRIEVVTDGLFLRRIQADPSLDGIAAVLFDEFHERGIDGDLSLALCLEAQEALRPDLRLLVMSATLEGDRVAALMGGAPVVRSDGRLFPVELSYGGGGDIRGLPDRMATAVRAALAEYQGDILAFLPGAGEIERTAERLSDRLPAAVDLHRLHGTLSLDAQDAAVRPAPAGRRKVVLATNVAETSLTIEGIRVVIDGGYRRAPRFDPNRGFTRLETVRISQASAEQRRGRAGRLAPGHCIRLWDAAEQRGLVAHDPPEVLSADLAPLALELAAWGAASSGDLRWLDPPPDGAMAQARDLLRGLDALDAGDRITGTGRRMSDLGAHPRLARMMLAGRELGAGATACLLAALLSERDVRPGRGADLRDRLARPPDGARRLMALWTRTLGVSEKQIAPDMAGRLIARAFPDRLAQARGGEGRYRLSGGGGAALDPLDGLAGSDFLAVAEMGGIGGAEPRIRLAAPIDRADLEKDFADRIVTVDRVGWDDREGAVVARTERRLDTLVLQRRPLAHPEAGAVSAAVLEGIRGRGLDCLPWDDDARALQARVAFLRGLPGGTDDWPDLSDAALEATLEDWLSPYLSGITRAAQFGTIPLRRVLEARLDWDRRQRLDEGAPERLTVPSGSALRVDYSQSPPVLAVKLQEMFGCGETPTVAWGRVPVVLHLLSPAGRPLQVTQDLAGFWQGSYAQVKAEMKGRYPKHSWPDDPAAALPTRRTKARAGNG